MSRIELILIVGLLIIVVGKWIVFLIITPFFLLYKKIHKKIRENNESSKETEEREETTPKNKKSWIRNLATRLYFYFMGLLRYFDIQVGLIPSHHIRNFIYRHILGVKMEENAIIYYGGEIRDHFNLKIGKGSIVGDRAILDARNGIDIGENVNLSSCVSIWTEQHDYRDTEFRCRSSKSFRVKIGNRAWIGPNVIILHSVEIGEGAVVGAGSVVTKDVAPFSVVAGIPAKQVRERPRDLKYEFNGKYTPFL